MSTNGSSADAHQHLRLDRSSVGASPSQTQSLSTQEVSRDESEEVLGPFLTERWMPARSATWADGTLRFRVWAINEVLVPDLGNRQLASLSAEDLSHWVAVRSTEGAPAGRRPLAPGTLRNVYSVLNQALGDAERWGLLTRSPARGIRLPRSVPSARVWTLEQIRYFLDQTAGSRYSCLWRLMFATGLRRGEALGLRWSDIDWVHGLVHVERALLASSRRTNLVYGPVKTPRSRRTIALDPGTVEQLRKWYQRRIDESSGSVLSGALFPKKGSQRTWTHSDESIAASDPLFVHEGGLPYLPAGVSDTFRREVRRAGLPPIRLHDIRHAHLTYLLRAGEPIQNVSARAGHASPFLTLTTYAHVIPGDAAETVKRTGGMFS